jgi:NADPH:quinone reductase-like Zn-dependent oxidoreductase
MMRAIGFDHVIDYQKEDFTRNGRRYDLIIDTRTNRWPLEYLRSLNRGGTYATVGGAELKSLFAVLFVGWAIRLARARGCGSCVQGEQRPAVPRTIALKPDSWCRFSTGPTR